MDVLWANEIDKSACLTYRLNFQHSLIEGDVQKIDPKQLEPVDILSAGFPCQPFSIAGYQKGFRDERGNLFFEIMRFAKYLKPKVIFLENVKNLKGHNQGRTLKIIQDCLEANGYWVHDQVLNTCEFSRLPQNRERIYIVAFQQKKAFEAFAYPDKIEDTESPQTFLNDEVDEIFYYTNSKYYPEIKPEMTSPNSIYQWRRVYLRENKSGVCPTLTANMGTGGHNVPLIVDNKGIRKLTPRECLRFQGFPDDFKIPDNLPRSAIYKQAGNSVSVPIITAIAHQIKSALKWRYNFDKTVADELEFLLKQNLRGDELRRVQVIYWSARYGYSQQEIAERTGLSKGTVSNLHSRWHQQGLDMLEIKSRGGANHRYMSEHEEKEWIAYRIQKSGEEGHILTVPQIQLAYEARIGKKVAKSTVYDLLHRHEWRKRQKNGAPPGLRGS